VSMVPAYLSCSVGSGSSPGVGSGRAEPAGAVLALGVAVGAATEALGSAAGDGGANGAVPQPTSNTICPRAHRMDNLYHHIERDSADSPFSLGLGDSPLGRHCRWIYCLRQESVVGALRLWFTCSMDGRLLCALAGLSFMGAFVACDFDAGAEAGADAGGGNGPAPTGTSTGAGIGGDSVDDPDTLVVDAETGGGDGFGGGASQGGGGGAAPVLPVPDECAGLEYADPVEFVVAPTDSHSTGSAAYAREMLDACQAPAPGVLETSHFLNLHDLGYVRSDGQLHGYLDLLPTTDPYLFIVQGAVGATKSRLAPGDTIAIYGWNATAVLERTDGGDQGAVQNAIDALSADNEFDGALTDGLNAALGSAKAQLENDGEHSLVFLTDGGEPMSAQDESTLTDIGSESRLSFLGVGVGPAEQYSPALLRDMTTLASGKLHFLGGEAGFDAQSLFGDRFQRLFNVAARTALLEVTMPAYFEVVETPKTVFVGDVGSLRERTLAPGGTILFRQVVKVCHPDIVNLVIPAMTGLVTFEDPAFGAIEGATSHVASALVAFPISIASNGSNPAANAEALITFADALRGPVSARLDAASSFIEGSTAADANLRSELGQLLVRHPNHPATECAL